MDDFVQWMKNVQTEAEVALHKAHDAMQTANVLKHHNIKLEIEFG